ELLQQDLDEIVRERARRGLAVQGNRDRERLRRADPDRHGAVARVAQEDERAAGMLVDAHDLDFLLMEVPAAPRLQLLRRDLAEVAELLVDLSEDVVLFRHAIAPFPILLYPISSRSATPRRLAALAFKVQGCRFKVGDG